jgi:hypothetical protein
LWGDKKRDVTASQVRHLDKRRRLFNYLQHNEGNVDDSIVDLVDLPTKDAIEDEFSDKSSASNEFFTEKLIERLGCISPDIAAKLTEKDCTMSISATNSASKDETSRRQPCPGCKRPKIINKYCKLHVCKACCSESTEECTLTDHKRSKKIGPSKSYEQTSLAHPILPGLLEKVQSAISAKKSLYISYDGGTKSNQLRKIDPKQFTQGKDGKLVESYCHLVKDVRHFYLYKIKRIENHDWAQPGMLRNFVFSLYINLYIFI